MDWQDVGVLVAMVGVTASFGLTWRGQKQDKEIAEASASRSEAAASLSADNSERVVLALEAIAAKDFSGGGQAPPPSEPRVRWTLDHHAGDTYILTNEGDAPAFSIEVTGHESMIGPDRIAGGQDLQGGEALTFLAARSMATSDSTIKVSWLDAPGGAERHEWRYPLPPRPKR